MPCQSTFPGTKQRIALNDVEIQEQEDDTREEEAARQKEFLEKVVISQKGQLRQLEKVKNIDTSQHYGLCANAQVQKLNSAKMLRDNKVLLKEIDTLKREMVEMKKFKVKLPVIRNEERRMS